MRSAWSDSRVRARPKVSLAVRCLIFVAVAFAIAGDFALKRYGDDRQTRHLVACLLLWEACAIFWVLAYRHRLPNPPTPRRCPMANVHDEKRLELERALERAQVELLAASRAMNLDAGPYIRYPVVVVSFDDNRQFVLAPVSASAPTLAAAFVAFVAAYNATIEGRKGMDEKRLAGLKGPGPGKP